MKPELVFPVAVCERKLQGNMFFFAVIEHWTLEPRELDFFSAFSPLCRPVFGDRVCPLCEREIPSHQNCFDHLNSDHLNNVYGLGSPQKYFRE